MITNRSPNRAPKAKEGPRRKFQLDMKSDHFPEALNWAIYSFKRRAMTVSSDFLATECHDILEGQATVDWELRKLNYPGHGDSK